jgi:LPS-assembly lipoprotein
MGNGKWEIGKAVRGKDATWRSAHFRFPASGFRLLALMLICAVSLVACGFHMRGVAKISPALARVRVEPIDVNSPLKRDLELALKRNEVVLADSAATDAAVIKLPLMQLVTEPLTVGRTARVKEFRVRYKIEIEITGADGHVLLARTPIELTRDYSFDETQALGAQAEEELLKKELGRDMVQQILRRLETVH